MQHLNGTCSNLAHDLERVTMIGLTFYQSNQTTRVKIHETTAYNGQQTAQKWESRVKRNKSKLNYCFEFCWRPFLGYSTQGEIKRELSDPAKLKRQIRAHDYQGNQNMWSARRGKGRWRGECYRKREGDRENHSRNLYANHLESLIKYYCIYTQGKSP